MARNRLSRILTGILGLIGLLILAAGIYGIFTVRRSFPQVNGELQVAGLDAPVEVIRDPYGVPAIYASTQHDLFFTQGYVHAQDRFWQMDFWRHIGSGRLSELFGEGSLGQDRFLRTLGLDRIVQRELAEMDADSRSVLEAYAEGVNAYLAARQGSALSLEYAILGLTNAAYRPEPWIPQNTLTWAKMMAWDLRSNMDEEIERAVLLKYLSPEQLAEVMPSYADDMPLIIPGSAGQTNSGTQPDGLVDPAMLAAITSAGRAVAAVSPILGPAGEGIGSNNWVLSGQRTTTGLPFLANDPHLSAQMPSIWYQVGLHCQPQGPGCPYSVAGFSFAGVPGVVVGHNDRIAWGVTNLGPDVQDLYIEKVNPQNPNQYEVNGQWVDMEIHTETLQVGGGEPVALAVRGTRHGPIISGLYGPDDFAAETGMALPEPYAIALRWTALEPTYTYRAIIKIDRAQNWEEFRAALQDFDVPSQNFVYADVDGNIGYQSPGNIPIRAAGDGTQPVPGWTDEHEWTGYIPFEELPTVFNPPQGYISTANNAVVGADYPYLLTKDWDYGFRARRIVQMIEGAPGPIDAAYIQRMQGDNKNLNAEMLVPYLMELPLEEARLERARALFQGWDYQDGMDSAPAALFNAFWKRLMVASFEDDLPEEYWPVGTDRWWMVVHNLAGQLDSPWWDNQDTAAVEDRDTIFRQAFSDAVGELETALGKDPEKWKWGDLHTTTFRNQSLGNSGIGPIEALFNRGPFRTAGGGSILNATGWSTAADGFDVRTVPSMRMIVDLSDLDKSLTVHTTGQSGHAYHPHYIDLANLWRTIQYYPMRWSRTAVEAGAEGTLRLSP